MVLECGLTRSTTVRARGHELEVLAVRAAVGRRAPGGLMAAAVLPVAVVERQGTRRRWRPVPDLTLAATALGMALAAWIAFGPRASRAESSRIERAEG